MREVKKRFIINEKGERVGVVLDVRAYRKLLAAVEELESIRAYDRAKASGDKADAVPRAAYRIGGKVP